MIAVLPQDQVSTTSAEINQYLEAQVETMTAELSCPFRLASETQSHWNFIHDAFRLKAAQAANDIDAATRTKVEQELELGRKLLEAKRNLTRRGEFSGFREKLLISLAEGRKMMKIFERFGSWSVDKLLIISRAVNLYTLCQSKFDQVVQQLFDTANLTKEFIKNLVKEVRDAARAQSRKKQQTAPASGWRHDPSGGGRHYQLPPMYNEEAAMTVESLAQERGVRAIIVVEEAIALFGEQTKEVCRGIFPEPTSCRALDELRRQHQEELQAVVSEVRDENIQMQRKLIERDVRIAELEQRGVAGGRFPRQTRFSAQTPVTVAVEHNFSSWVEFADTVECDSKKLLATVKPWSLQERQSLSVLLAEHLSEDQSALDQVAWVPDKLLYSALSKLSFCVSKISGPDNMMDEPEIEEINGCRFVSVQHLGIRRPSGDARRLEDRFAIASCYTWAKPKTALDSPRTMDV